MTETVPWTALSAAESCDYINIVTHRLEHLETNTPETVAPLTLSEVATALGVDVASCELWRRNWRNRIYRVQLGNGELAVAKQIVFGDDASVQYQHDQLAELARMGIPELHVPKPLALIGSKRAFVMEFAHGRTLRELARHGGSIGELVSLCERAGQILARVHLFWTQDIAPFPVEVLRRDFAAAPWHLSSNEKQTLQDALAGLSQAKVSLGQVFYDYQSKNLIYDKGELTLIDPADAFWLGIHLWDYARFRGGLRRMLWRVYLRQPLSRHRHRGLRETFAAFKRGYLERFNKQHPEPAYFPVVTRLLELQHTAMSMAMNKRKLGITRRGSSARRFLSTAKTTLTTQRLLELEKRWLFQQLARELP